MNIPHEFANPGLLAEALTHSSAATDGLDNERLEFLGDAVLELVVSEWLVATHPSWNENNLSKARARLVSAPALAALSDAWGLAEGLRLGKGERANHIERNINVRADAFEAVVAAIYADGGLPAARAAVVPLLASRLAAVETLIDPRSMLLQWSQAQKIARPEDVDKVMDGPAHARDFSIKVQVAGQTFGPGRGKTWQAAKAEAARMALAGLGVEISDG